MKLAALLATPLLAAALGQAAENCEGDACTAVFDGDYGDDLKTSLLQRVASGKRNVATISAHEFVNQSVTMPGKCAQTAGCGRYRRHDHCHCNDKCEKYGTCCEDYKFACSRKCAATGCGPYVHGASCQCTADCAEKGNCCSDFDGFCNRKHEHCPAGKGGSGCSQDRCTDDSDCSGKGVAFGLKGSCSCTCKDGFSGTDCSQAACDASDCNGRGVAEGVKGSCKCTCNAGWGGDTCNSEPCTDADDCNFMGSASGFRPNCKCACDREHEGDRCEKKRPDSCEKLGCLDDHVKENLCQCHLECFKHNNCCKDFASTCQKHYYKPEDKRLLKPSDGKTMTFYAYRAQSPPGPEGYYAVENVNLASMGGVLWYLHNEIIQTCWGAGSTGGSIHGGTGRHGDRKFSISRIRRLKVTYKASQPLLDKGMNFGPLCSFDAGECTGPHRGTYWSGVGSGWGGKNELDEYGYTIGCGKIGEWPHQHWSSGKKYPNAMWYSVQGSCPAVTYNKKWDSCKMELPGGACDDPTGAGNCTFKIEDAGEIDLDELVGIKPRWKSRSEFCHRCGVEGGAWARGGCGLSFWGHNIWDVKSNQEQVKKALDMFAKKYPNDPTPEDYPDPVCDFDKKKYGFVRN